MLILSRKTNETIVITDGDNVLATIMVTSVRGEQVRIGIDAEPMIGIFRSEIWRDIQEDKRREKGK